MPLRSRILLDAGVFIAAASANRSTMAIMADAMGETMFFVAAHTFAEFYRGGRATAREARLVNLWRPEVLPIFEQTGRLAGELLAVTGGGNSMDALVIAVADLNRVTEIFTTDPRDLVRLRDARVGGSRPISVVHTQ